MKIMESVKEHPYIAAGGVFVLGVILIVILFSGGKATAQATAQGTQTDTSAATQLALAQVQAQAETQVSANNLAAANTASAASVSIAQLQAATQQNADTTGANASVTIAKTNADALVGQSTIQANMLQHASDNALQAALNTNYTNLQTTALNDQAATNQDTQNSQIQLQIVQSNNALAALQSDNDNYTKRVATYAAAGIQGN